MKHYFVLMAIILGMTAPSATAQVVKKKVAVYVTGDVENGYKKVIGSKLVTGITRSEDYSAVERTADFLAEMEKEQDYQMSGAVSDNQIARLGQQFGVRYVLVADVSEIFESIFISARMIDVQTAQITNSTESNEVVSNMESLTKLAENIVLKLFYVKEYAKDEIKILGPFSYVKELDKIQIPEGYRIAKQEEIKEIIQNNKIFNKKTSFPIYTNLKSELRRRTQYYIVYSPADKKGNQTKQQLDRPYYEIFLICSIIKDINSMSTLNLSYIDDYSYPSFYQSWNDSGYSTSGMYSKATNPSITPGYVYLIKAEEKNK